MGNNTAKGKGDEAVFYVSWNDVQEFIIKLNEQTGEKYRLPTEAEWEFAARGGVSSKGFMFSGSNNLDEVAWSKGYDGGGLPPVGTKAPNELGIHDMSGYVWQWVNDWYGNYSGEAVSDPRGPSSGSDRVIRGGFSSSSNVGTTTRVSYRHNLNPDKSSMVSGVGFRLARDSR